MSFNERAKKYFYKAYPDYDFEFDECTINDIFMGSVVKRPLLAVGHNKIEDKFENFIAIERFGGVFELRALPSIYSYFRDINKKAPHKLNVSPDTIGSGKDKIRIRKVSVQPKIRLYTDELQIPRANIFFELMQTGLVLEILEEKELFSTVFISYGGTDEVIVEEINEFLNNHGIKTWFFKRDSLPGEKLHRMMSDEIENHDKVLLVCSKDSLSRNGVLNEIERVLEREAREGGNDILTPITIDDFVFNDWKSKKPDIERQVKSRVITQIVQKENPSVSLKELNKLVRALKNR